MMISSQRQAGRQQTANIENKKTRRANGPRALKAPCETKRKSCDIFVVGGRQGFVRSLVGRLLGKGLARTQQGTACVL